MWCGLMFFISFGDTFLDMPVYLRYRTKQRTFENF